jgi:Taurine catabolism dioxygenase TauD, TfdA family
VLILSLAPLRYRYIITYSCFWFRFGSEPSYTSRPLLFYTPQEKIIIQYARRYFTGFQALPRTSSIPPISEAQAEALDALHFLGEKFNLGLNFQKGDIQFINNLGVFHARDGYRDEGSQKYVV